ncbi:uncharacterized protein N7500_006696 [Penicillium coprophilum]|uniref:uncharacterized protein n=1 Tax=Penicillium coprophilum TaxID=36646 RepID=UPI00238C3987|nr:uncharacterized protein N7500_006696 [Penicillium coprophilum]KAJ5164866.1 hypothetical protein N7500_006696 [Penicillium coprophilum]
MVVCAVHKGEEKHIEQNRVVVELGVRTNRAKRLAQLPSVGEESNPYPQRIARESEAYEIGT